MNQSELAQKMLEWETLMSKVNTLSEEIETAVLELGKTVDAGNVRASYSGGRKKYHYEEAGSNAHYSTIKRHTALVQKVDWKKVCESEDFNMENSFTQSHPNVTLKLK